METDVKLYLECLKYTDNPNSTKDSLYSLANLLSSSNKDVKEKFRDCKGLHLLLRTLLLEKNENVKQATLFALSCAVDNCISSQNLMIQKEVIRTLADELRSPKCQNKTFAAITLFLSYLTQGNSLGQNKVRECGILSVFVQKLRLCYPTNNKDKEIWMCILTCLSSLVNNPRNSVNQELLMEIMPMCLASLKRNTNDVSFVRSLSSFIRQCLSDNEVNQMAFNKAGCLGACFDILGAIDMSKQELIDVGWSVISLISSVPESLLNCETNQIRCVKLLVKWMEIAKGEDLSNCLHTLALAVENNTTAREILLTHRSCMSGVLRCLSLGDDNTKKTAQLLLQLLFYNSRLAEKKQDCNDDSDLESASHEINKIASSSNSKNKGLPGKLNIRKRTKSKIVKIRPQWDEPPEVKPEIKLLTKVEPKSQFEPIQTKTVRISTPDLSPMKCETNTATVNAEFTSTAFQNMDVDSQDSVSDANTVSQLSERESQTRNYIGSMANIAYQKMDEKMEEFFERFERTLRTNLSSVPSDTSNCTVKTDKDCQTDGSVYKEMSTNTDMSANLPSKKRKIKSFSSPVADKETIASIQTSAVLPCQKSLIESFFSLNPNLLPFEAKTPLPKPIFENSCEISSEKQSQVLEDSGFGNSSSVSTTASTAWPCANLSRSFNDVASERYLSSSKSERPKKLKDVVPFTEQELANLCKGVQVFGRCWSAILMRFEFHPSRTALDLIQQYSAIKRFYTMRNHNTAKNWTNAEKRRLKRGVGKFGANWAKILRMYNFNQDKTKDDLCDMWLKIGY